MSLRIAPTGRILQLNVKRVGHRVPTRKMLSEACSRIDTNSGRLAQRGECLIQLWQVLSRIVESAIDESANLEEIIHDAQEVRLAVNSIRGNAWIVDRVVVLRPAVRQGQRMTQFMSEGTGLNRDCANLVIAIVLAGQ